MDNLDGYHSAELGVNDLIRDLNRLTFLNELEAEPSLSKPIVLESSLLSFFPKRTSVENLISNFDYHRFEAIKLKSSVKSKFSIQDLVIDVANWSLKPLLYVKQGSHQFVQYVRNSFTSAIQFISNYSVSLWGKGQENVLNNVVQLTKQVKKPYVYSINSLKSSQFDYLKVVRAASIFGLVLILISPATNITAFADETLISDSTTSAPEETPTPEPNVGDEVIVEETPAISADEVVVETPVETPTESPSPEPTIACVTEIALNEDGSPVDPTQVLCETPIACVTEIALNEDGSPVDPTQVLCEKPLPVVIEAPTNLNYQVLVEGIKLTWDKSTSTVDKYVVNIGPDNRNIDVNSDTAELLLTDLNRKAAYSFTVTAISGELQSAVLGPLNLDLASIKFPRPPMNAEVGGLIVKFNTDLSSSEVTALADNNDLVPVELEVSKEISTDTRLVEFNEPVNLTTAQEIADSLEASSAVEFAELDFAFNTASEELSNVVPNDPLYASKQWSLWGNFGIGIANGPTGLALAYQNSTGLGSVVAVIDTGFTSHPDLDGQFVSGYDFVSNNEMLSGIREENGTAVPYDGDYIDANTYGPIGWDDNPQDPGDWNSTRSSSWHGTHVAGLIAALTNNGIGIAGIAPDAKIQPIRAFSWRGGLLSDVIASITWASGGTVENVPVNQTPAKVINLSFSVEAPCTPSLQQAIDDAVARGSVVVAASGNNNQNANNFAPGNCNNVITVGAIDSNGDRANYSNFGDAIDISAPGGELDGQAIYSTSNDGNTTPTSAAYSVKQGTSIAAAYV